MSQILSLAVFRMEIIPTLCSLALSTITKLYAVPLIQAFWDISGFFKDKSIVVHFSGAQVEAFGVEPFVDQNSFVHDCESFKSACKYIWK